MDFIEWDEAKRLFEDEGWTCKRIADRMGSHEQTIARGLLRRGLVVQKPSPASASPVGAKLYVMWNTLRSACRNPKSLSWDKYGALGIRIGPAWPSFRAFHDWAKKTRYAPGMRLAVRPATKVLGPNTCHWITSAQWVRRTRRAAHCAPRGMLRAFGEIKGVTEWTQDERCVVAFQTLARRLRVGWPAEVSLTTPANVRYAGPRKRGGEFQSRRKSVQEHVDWAEAERRYAEGATYAALGRAYGVSLMTMLNGLKARGVKTRTGMKGILDPHERVLRTAWNAMKQRPRWTPKTGQ